VASSENSYVSLENSKDSQDLLQSHRQIQQYWSDKKDAIGIHYDFLMGRPWSADDLLAFARLNKEPVTFHQIKASERTVMGLFIQNKYDVKFSPVEPGDQDLSDIWNQLYISLEGQQRWNFLDIDFFRQAWAGGVSYQECYVQVSPGMEPKICTRNQNVFAIYEDPESRDFILRRDRRFMDRVSWLTLQELLDEWPDIIAEEDLASQDITSSTTFQKTTVYRDRSHEAYDTRNGKFKVVERFYKVMKKVFYTLDDELRRISIEKKDLAQFKKDYPEQEIYNELRPELWLAIICPAWRNNEYIFNEAYHCNPIDEATGDLIWPILEMVAEGLNGESMGFVEPQVSPSKIVNSMMSNILGAAKHAANTSYIRKANAFIDEKEGKLFDKRHSDNDRVFKAKDNVNLGDVVIPIPKGETGRDTSTALEFSMAHLKEVSSTPPALQGITEEKGASGILNAQRIEQAYIQLQVLVANWKAHLQQRAKLVQYYIRKYYTYEKNYRYTDRDTGKPAFLTINQQVPEMDHQGQQTGALMKVNDVSTSIYDMVIEDSFQSPTFRYKTQQQISELLQSPAVQSDPVLMGMLFLEFTRVSDVSQDLKTFIKEHSTVAQQQAQQQQAAEAQKAQQEAQAGQIQNAAAMQGLAQTEAEQTFGAPPAQRAQQTPAPPPGAQAPPPGAQAPFQPPPGTPTGSARRSLNSRPTAFTPAPAGAVPV
jgi:hypothetical protein